MKIAHKNYKFYSDPGHGWLCVSQKKIVKLGIADKISEFSHIRKDNVFLEEDVDAPLFLGELKKRGFKYDIECLQPSNKLSKIRNYQSYKWVSPIASDDDCESNEKLVIKDGMAMLVPC